jgi:hypothetical protein
MIIDDVENNKSSLSNPKNILKQEENLKKLLSEENIRTWD